MGENELADILDDQYIVDNENEDNAEHQEEEAKNEVNVEQDEDEAIDGEDVEQEEEENEDDEYVPPQSDDEDVNGSNATNVNDNGNNNEDCAGVRRSTRPVNSPTRYGTLYQHLQSKEEADNCEEYSKETAVILAHIISQYATMNTRRMSKKKLYQFAQTYTLNKGIKKFGEKWKIEGFKVMKQLHERIIFKPIRVENLTELEKKRRWKVCYF